MSLNGGQKFLYVPYFREGFSVSDIYVSFILSRKKCPHTHTHINMSAFLHLFWVTCSEVISQQAEDPFSEDTGSEQVVAVVVHCKLCFHLRVKVDGEIADI